MSKVHPVGKELEKMLDSLTVFLRTKWQEDNKNYSCLAGNGKGSFLFVSPNYSIALDGAKFAVAKVSHIFPGSSFDFHVGLS